MQKSDSILPKGLAVFSVLTSFAFVYYGVSMLASDSSSSWAEAFAYICAGYGLGNIYILSWAWRGGGKWPSWTNKLIALCFFAAFVLDLWKEEVAGNLEYVGVLGIAGILWLNWLAVRNASQRHSP